MVKFGQLVDEGKGTYRKNPITKAFGVIIYEDKMDVKDKQYSILINSKEYKLNINPFDSKVRDVTLDTNKISEEQLKDAEIKIY